MTDFWSRRAFLAAAGAGAAALAGCGSGTIESALTPSRILSVGDGFSDVGQAGVRYTVNDGSVNVWSAQLAADYGLGLQAVSAGGLSWAQGGARVAGAAPSVESQVTALLGSQTLGANDLVLVGAGLTDIVAEVTALGISAQTTANVQAAGTVLAAQVRRLVTAGAKYVLVAGVYNLGISPWGVGLNQATALADLCNAFNHAFLVGVVDLGANVLFVDAALYFNLVNATPSYYSLVNVTAPVCTTPDATTCTPATLAAGIDVGQALFADAFYLTPVANRLFGTHAYTKLRERW